MKKIRKANKRENQVFKEWKNRLGLQDWRIKLYVDCAPEEMTLDDVVGCTEWQESIKAAKIEILSPKHYEDRVIPFDIEKTLVHELLHLKTSLISSNVGELQERITHQLIDDLARAFVDAKRKDGGNL